MKLTFWSLAFSLTSQLIHLHCLDLTYLTLALVNFETSWNIPLKGSLSSLDITYHHKKAWYTHLFKLLRFPDKIKTSKNLTYYFTPLKCNFQRPLIIFIPAFLTQAAPYPQSHLPRASKPTKPPRVTGPSCDLAGGNLRGNLWKTKVGWTWKTPNQHSVCMLESHQHVQYENSTQFKFGMLENVGSHLNSCLHRLSARFSTIVCPSPILPPALPLPRKSDRYNPNDSIDWTLIAWNFVGRSAYQTEISHIPCHTLRVCKSFCM